MMNRMNFAAAAAFASGLAFAAPHVDQADVTLTQDRSRKVTISYTLKGDPGIVTVDIQTNTLADATGAWVSIGAEHLFGFEGAVNRLVTDVDTPSTITWQADEYWPNHKLRGGIVRAEVKAWPTNNPPDVVVFDLIGGDMSFYTSLEALPGGISSDDYKVTKLVLRRCHAAGRPFRMGSPLNEPNRATGDYHTEDPRVGTISSDYYLGIYELTEGQFQSVNPSRTGVPANTSANRKPHVNFTWNTCRGSGTGDYNWPTKGHAVDPASIMGCIRKVIGQDVDLPTAAQWEFACRAGTATAFSNGEQTSTDRAKTCGWCSDNAEGAIHEVGTIYANAWGFCDMHGNASEWVLNFMCNYPQNYDFENGPDAGPADHKYIGDTHRAIRGGGFTQAANLMRSARVSDWAVPNASSDHPSQIGCRICLPAVIRY